MNDRQTAPPTVDRRTFLAAAGAVAVAGCGAGSTDGGAGPGTVDDDYDHPTPTDDVAWEVPADSPVSADFEVEPLVENLDVPWDVAFAGNGEMFVTERTGTLLRFHAGELADQTELPGAIDAGSVEPGSDGNSWWVEGGEGGTLGVAVHPAYPDPPAVYVYYTTAETGGATNRVVRYDVSADDPTATATPVVEGIPANDYHNGGRLAFGPDGSLWVTTGDAGDGTRAQDPSSLAGKVLRVAPDGRAPASNPDLGGDPRVFTYGHRNPQGLAWLPSGVVLATEHGPSGRDEVNVLYSGGNYGWPDVRGGPGDDEYGAYPDHDDVVPPVVTTGPAVGWAPSGATFYTGEAVPPLRNRLLVGGLVSQSVWAVTLTPAGHDPPPTAGRATRFDASWLAPSYTATAHRLLRDRLGRVRALVQSPAGEAYAITSNRDGRASGDFPRENDDVLVRITTA